MRLIQQTVLAVLPKSWGEAIEAESKQWRIHCGHCPCSHSVWELGGIRFMAAGRPRVYRKCPKCQRWSWHLVSKETPRP